MNTYLWLRPTRLEAARNLFEITGDVCKKPQLERHELRALTNSLEMFVVGFVLENPCVYLHEVCQQSEDISGVPVSVSTICRLLP